MESSTSVMTVFHLRCIYYIVRFYLWQMTRFPFTVVNEVPVLKKCIQAKNIS